MSEKDLIIEINSYLSSTSVTLLIDNPKLVKLCKKYHLELNISNNKIDDELDLGECGLQRKAQPTGGSFVDWFISFADEIEILSDEAREAIGNSRKAIEDDMISSEIIYEHWCNDDEYDNCHWEERRTKKSVQVKGFDTVSWEDVWNNTDHNEIAKLTDGKLDVESYNPNNYPYWLLLKEGWASSENGESFVKKMMNVYGTKNYTTDELAARTKEKEYIDFYRRYEVNPDDIDFKGKTVCVGELEWLNFDDPRKTAFRNDGLALDIAKLIIENAGGKATKSVSGKTDYAVVSTEQKILSCAECSERDLYNRHLESLDLKKKNYLGNNEKRKAKNLPEIQIVFLDDFCKWLLKKHSELKEINDIFHPFGVLNFGAHLYNDNAYYSWKNFKSEAFADITPEILLEAFTGCKTIRDVVTCIEKVTTEGALSTSNLKSYINMLKLDEQYLLSDYQLFYISFNSSGGNEFVLHWHPEDETFQLTFNLNIS